MLPVQGAVDFVEMEEKEGPDVLKARTGDAAEATRPTGAPPGPSTNLGGLLRGVNHDDGSPISLHKTRPGSLSLRMTVDPDAKSRLPALEGAPEPDLNIEPLPAEGNVTSVSRPTPSGPRPTPADVIPLHQIVSYSSSGEALWRGNPQTRHRTIRPHRPGTRLPRRVQGC